MRTTLRLLTLLVVALTASTVALASAGAQEGDDTDDAGPREVIDVVQVAGLLDPIVVDDLLSRLDRAEASVADGTEDVLGLILQINSAGAVVDDGVLADLYDRLATSPVPIGAWIGPSGSQALGGSLVLVGAADFSAISEGSRMGDLGEPIPGVPEDLLGPETDLVRFRTLGRADARDAGLVDSSASVIGDFVLEMMDAGELPERTEEQVLDDGLIRRNPSVDVRFNRLPFVDSMFHTMASPAITYLLLLAALGLLLLEFYTAGVGIAGGVGVICALGAGYGLGTLPVNSWAVGLLVLSTIAFAVDVQTGVPRFWSAVGLVALVVGSLNLFTGPEPSWITYLAGMVGMLLLMFTAMPNLVRTRFSTTTLGREWMLGELGEAVEPVDPDGTVKIREALWRARTNRATPIAQGDRIRVVELDGTVLEVEPEDGGAVDYREKRRRRGS